MQSKRYIIDYTLKPIDGYRTVSYSSVQKDERFNYYCSSSVSIAFNFFATVQRSIIWIQLIITVILTTRCTTNVLLIYKDRETVKNKPDG